MIVGIICEYNPFHNGHKYQIDQIKKMYPDSTVVAIMSGNLTQRGEFALFDKYTRAKAAVLCGVDCVFELPYPYCASNAEIFAKAGVYIAASLGISHLCFGTESGELDYVLDIAKTVDSEEYERSIKEILDDKAIPYPVARERALLKLGKRPPKLSNEILGVEYIRAIRKYGDKIIPVTVKREGAGYNDLSVCDIMSASAIREYFVNNNTFISVPEIIKALYYDAYKDGYCLNNDIALEYLYRSVVMSSPSALSECYDIPIGAEFFIYDKAQNSKNAKEFFQSLTTKNYTYARLKRIIIYYVMGTKNIREMPHYTILLSANSKGREMLKSLRKKCTFPIITKPADYRSFEEDVVNQFEESSRVDKLYLSFMKEKKPSDHIKSFPYIIM